MKANRQVFGLVCLLILAGGVRAGGRSIKCSFFWIFFGSVSIIVAKRGEEKPFIVRLFLNNILNYEG